MFCIINFIVLWRALQLVLGAGSGQQLGRGQRWVPAPHWAATTPASWEAHLEKAQQRPCRVLNYFKFAVSVI